MNDQRRADTWRDHVGRRLDEIRVALLDLIDVGVPGAPPESRPPSSRERAATDRADGDFRPTVRAPSSKTAGDITYGDPTGGDVVSWEGEVQDATTRLYAAVAVALEVAEQFGLEPTTEDNQSLPAPVEPPTRKSKVSERRIVDLPPRSPEKDRADCRTAALAGVAYIAAVADAIADRMTAPDIAEDPEIRGGAHWALDAGAHWLEAAVGSLAFRLAPPPPRPETDERRAPDRPSRSCACDWDGCPHGPGDCPNEHPDRTCGTCRQRKTAAKRAAS